MGSSVSAYKLLKAALSSERLDGVLAAKATAISTQARQLALSGTPDDGSYVSGFGTASEPAPGSYGNRDHLAVNNHPDSSAIELGHRDRSGVGWVDGRHDLANAARGL